MEQGSNSAANSLALPWRPSCMKEINPGKNKQDFLTSR